MYDFILNEMADAVAIKLDLCSDDRSSVRDALGCYWQDRIAGIWNVEDVLQVAEEEGVSLTIEEARGVLRRVLNRMDASIGINWDVIRYYVREAVED